MSRKDALDCWVNTCLPNTIFWEKHDNGNTTYSGTCSECKIFYEIGVTIGGGMTVSHDGFDLIKELNK